MAERKDGIVTGQVNLNKVHFKDQRLSCCDCGSTFIFTAGEQASFQSKGLSTPKRCKPCRLKRKLTLVREGGEL